MVREHGRGVLQKGGRAFGGGQRVRAGRAVGKCGGEGGRAPGGIVADAAPLLRERRRLAARAGRRLLVGNAREQGIHAEAGRRARYNTRMATLTDKQIKAEEEFLRGMPPINIGAFLLPPIWGPAHGMWATIIFYPLWLLADNTFYAAWAERTPLAVGVAGLVFFMLVVLTLAFARVSQPFAAHRAIARGVSKAEYLRRERIWAVACAIVGAIMLAAATYYNLAVRPTIGA